MGRLVGKWNKSIVRTIEFNFSVMKTKIKH